MAVQLGQSPFLSLISAGRIQQTLRLMDQPSDTRLTPEIAREICERTASAAVVNGSIASLGSQYILGLRAQSCRTGDILAEEQVQAAGKEDVLNALGKMARKFRTRVGESLTTVEEHNIPLETATTSSLEALKAYSTAMQSSSAGFADAIAHLKRAVEIDQRFAMAYASMGLFYSYIGESVLSLESTKRPMNCETAQVTGRDFLLLPSTNEMSRETWKRKNRHCGYGDKPIRVIAMPMDYCRDLLYPAPASMRTRSKRPILRW